MCKDDKWQHTCAKSMQTTNDPLRDHYKGSIIVCFLKKTELEKNLKIVQEPKPCRIWNMGGERLGLGRVWIWFVLLK